MIAHFLENCIEKVENLGLNSYFDWFDLAIEGMRKGEICLVIIENLKYNGFMVSPWGPPPLTPTHCMTKIK